MLNHTTAYNYISQKGLPFDVQSGEIKIDCPFCGDTKKHLYVADTEAGLYHCKKCSSSGNLRKLQKHFGDEINGAEKWGSVNHSNPAEASQVAPQSTEKQGHTLDSAKAEKMHQALLGNALVLESIKQQRGYELETIKHFKLGLYIDSKERPWLAMPQYEYDVLVNIKYRSLDGKKDFFREKGCKSPLFNANAAQGATTAYVCESETDAVALYNSGFKNVVSSTTGAGSWNEAWTANLADAKRVYICYDPDEEGRKGASMVAKKLGPERCFNLLLPEGLDVCAFLKKHGSELFQSLITDAQSFTASKRKLLKISNTQGWLLERPQPLDYIFEGLLVKGCVGFISAVGGVGKTSFIIPMGFSLITGGSLFGVFNPTRAFRVLLICAEDSEEIVRQRFYFLARSIPESIRAHIDKAIAENLILICGQGLPLVEMDGNNPVFTEELDYLKELITKHKPDVVILDPKASFYGGLNENDNSHNTKFIEALRAIVDVYRTTVLFTHHESKANAGTATQFASRGGQALSDGARWQITLSRIDEKEAAKLDLKAQDVVKVTHVKSNYTKFFDAFYLQRDENGALDRLDVQAMQDARLLDAIKEVLSDGVKVKPRDVDRKEGKAFRDRVIEITGDSVRETKLRISEFLNDGRLQKVDGGYISAGLPTLDDSEASA